MEQPLGYVTQVENKVCHLKKAIYGLKQSPMTWLEKFNITISSIDFHRCYTDHCLCSAHKVWYCSSSIVC